MADYCYNNLQSAWRLIKEGFGKMKGLTEKQRLILDFIEEFQEKEGMAPTVYEIADNFHIKTSTVFAHVRALQRKSFINRSSKARSISIIKPKRKLLKPIGSVVTVPLLGRINAGIPVDNQEFKEGDVCCDASVFGASDPRKVFALKVQGESMRDLGILDGDIVVVRQSEGLKTGCIVVALVGGETTVKSYYPLSDGRIELRPANPDFHTQIYQPGQVQVQGQVVALQRKY